MDRKDIDQALERPRPQEPASSRRSEVDMIERVRLMTKVYTLYPTSGGQDREGLMRAMIDETLDIPAWWLQQALSRLCREPGRKFAPSVGEVRGVAVEKVRAWRRSVLKIEREAGRPLPPPNAARELAWAWAHEVEQRALAAGLEVVLRELKVPNPPDWGDPT